MAITLDGTLGITAPTYAGAIPSEYHVPVTGFKNRIINGACVIDQRNAGVSLTPTVTATYTLDRWKSFLTQASKFSVQQNAGAVTPPVGFTKYLGITSASAYSVLAADYFNISQILEGFNSADLAWGTANASAVTLSFKVYSSLTGTFGGCIGNGAGNRSYPFTYSIPVANTWTTISITIPGDTTGTWATDNTSSLAIYFNLGAGATNSGTAGSWSANFYVSATGSVSVVGTNLATFYITGVQLEKGSIATSFDYRPYGTELALCQRYYEVTDYLMVATGTLYSSGYWQVSKRVSPTIAILQRTSGTGGTVGASNFSVLSSFLLTAFTSASGIVFQIGGSAEL